MSRYSINNILKASAFIAPIALVPMLGTPAIAAGKSTLTIGQNADLASLDPTELRLGTYVSTHLLYNTLIRLDKEGHPQPELAKSWARSDDGRKLTLKLADNVKFHDGRQMTSKDVAFSLNYAKTPAVGANILPLAQMIETIETPDDQTVVLGLNGGTDAVFDLLDLAFIVDSENPKRIKTSGNGTGPFKLTNFEPGQNAVFARNDAYWRAKPALEKVEIKIIPDPQSAIAQLRAGTVDFLPSLNREGVEQLAKSEFKTGVAAPEGRVLDIGLNVKAPVLDKPEVRQAISMAVDRARIAKDVVGPEAMVKCLPWAARNTREATGLADSCTYDLAKAKALIEKAGASGAEIELLSYSQAEPALGATAQILQNSFREIGLTTNIVEMSEAAFVARFRRSNFQATTHFYVRAGRNPAAILLTAVPFRAKGNVAGVASKQYQDDVTLVTTAPPGEATDAAWKRINTFLLSENWVLPVSTLPVQWASSPNLKGVTFNLDGMPIFETATFE
ncbi:MULTISPECIES: ABC transporter substrate-binding protein [unclassified Chelatococcus]|uniref:ABC transporter substrate-binding protein n=1 Tax=unclassified Chelatococcus TaxID=2638111 RepID=UPI001BCADD04|nr:MULTISPECIES: ABC transporter substrate-binding protein [unclassified Chelatococcus]MBS7700360.1 ABC transporter substrate-binding protein [Chelatococcus sp. YT9]MBX3556156.1 ABC transporter substrate-binding protein [Chelatococcus sp.]